MRTSFEPRSVLCQFPVSQIPVPQLYTRLLVALTVTMTHHFHATRAIVSCARAHRHQRFFWLFWSRLRDSEILWNFSLRQVALALIRVLHVVSSCETHLTAHTYSVRLRRDLWWWDWRTVVESGGTRVLWSGRAIGIQGYETKRGNPQTW